MLSTFKFKAYNFIVTAKNHNSECYGTKNASNITNMLLLIATGAIPDSFFCKKFCRYVQASGMEPLIAASALLYFILLFACRYSTNYVQKLVSLHFYSLKK